MEVTTNNFISLPRWVVLGENGTAVIEDWDLQRLDVGQAAVDLTGKRPFVFRFANFEEPHSIL